MAQDERNFRSAYYEKVGFRSVEEKKSLEILLKDRPLDKNKLKQFCLRFTLPSSYRCYVWKVLLGVLSPYLDGHEFITKQRIEQYNNLLNCVETIRIVRPESSKAYIFYKMWMVDTAQINLHAVLPEEQTFLPIIETMVQFSFEDADTYWLSKRFYEHMKKHENDFQPLIRFTAQLLEREDNALFAHIKSNQIILPLEAWFKTGFSGILNDMALGKIWDKLCGGSSKILVFVIVVLLINQRNKLLQYSDTESAINIIRNIPEETAELVANKSIELWQQHGSPLTSST